MALCKLSTFVNLIRNNSQYPALCRTIIKTNNFNCSKPILIGSQRWLFHESHRKGGYDTEQKASNLEHIKNGYKELKHEIKLFGQEVKDLIETDPLLIARPGETDLIWCFNDPSTLDKFVTTADSDHNEGFSHCSLEMSPAGRARFHGYLDVRVPKDGRIKKAGYCAMRSKRIRILCTLAFLASGSYQKILCENARTYISQASASRAIRTVINAINHPVIINKYIRFPQNTNERQILKEKFYEKFKMPGTIGCVDGTLVSMVRPKEHEERYYCRKGYHARNAVIKSFKRPTTFDWHLYNTLVLKVRGDGRSYLLNISTEGYYDITWNDIYHYVLYTRGGPYWQISKIPFSKFVLGSKGRLQDKQTRMRFDRVTHFGISCGDKINGRFDLEIEYVGLEFDPTHDEEFAYEMYKTDKYIVGV